jgi:two-component system chemotaxis response regulator CheB
MLHPKNYKALAISSSTGGPEALGTVLKDMHNVSKRIPIFITQHIQPQFSKFFITNLSQKTGLNCLEAYDGMEVTSNKVIIAPGSKHLTIDRDFKVKLEDSEAVNFCKPSADVMLTSLATLYKSDLISLVLTGMGNDSFLGCKLVKHYKGYIIAQNKDSSVVWGMPKAVIDANLADEILDISLIANRIKQLVGVDNDAARL